MKTPTFIDQWLSGVVESDAIDDFVEAWHEGAGDGLELHEFLGLSFAEYARWVAQPRQLRAILEARKAEVPVERRVG